MPNFTEKRRYPRCSVQYLALINSGQKEPLKVNVSNVSKTGLLLNSLSDLDLNDPVEITITKENSTLDPISATGNVVWRKNHSSSREIGIHFSKIRWSETDRLLHGLRY
ncbi:MAG: PilZ domain-containing protein [Candidatus Omnitrophica bacterium]|jgi:hypothetical protein|nr:PilZ domain-containing protein [Candidatus Omnitrophota bacterium]